MSTLKTLKKSASSKKVKTVHKLSEDAATLLQRIVRLKAADENGYCNCVTCGKNGHFTEMQGGHYIERSKSSTKLLEENIHPQCAYCNKYGMLKTSTVLKYRDYMIEMYGLDAVLEIENLSKVNMKWSRPALIDLIKELKAQMKELEDLC